MEEKASDLFRSPTFSGANLLTFLLYAAPGASFFFIPFNLIRVQGYSPTAAGAANLPMILLMFFLSRWSGGLVARYGAKRPLIIGPLIAALGFALFALPGIGGSYWTTFFPAALVLGFGMAISVAPLTTAVMGAMDSHYAGTASGVNNAISRVAGLIAIAAFGLIILPIFASDLTGKLQMLNTPPAVEQTIMAQQDKLTGIEIPSGLSASMHAAVQQAISASFVAGFRALMLIAAGLAVCSSISSLLLIGGTQQLVGRKEPQGESSFIQIVNIHRSSFKIIYLFHTGFCGTQKPYNGYTQSLASHQDYCPFDRLTYPAFACAGCSLGKNGIEERYFWYCLVASARDSCPNSSAVCRPSTSALHDSAFAILEAISSDLHRLFAPATVADKITATKQIDCHTIDELDSPNALIFTRLVSMHWINRCRRSSSYPILPSWHLDFHHEIAARFLDRFKL